MYKLIIFQVFDRLTKWEGKELLLDQEYEKSADAELRALRWLMYRPNDIVMLVELETGVCKHCGRSIHEAVGWVVHKWMHDGGYRACLPDGATKAEKA